MTARNAATIASLALGLAVLCGAAACTNFYEIPIETPIQPKMDVSPFTRVLVAGFIGGGTDDVDANLETVRLLRSQLRSKSTLRVIEADVLPLSDAGRRAAGAAREQPASTDRVPPSPGGAADGQQLPAVAPMPRPDGRRPRRSRKRRHPQREGSREVQGIFANTAFWKKLGEEYQNPLIVTGTVLFTPTQNSGFVTTEREVYDQFGRRRVVPVRTYQERKGFILRPKFIFIDGRTGATLYSETFNEQVLYNAQQNTPALSSYFELMDKLIPSFLNALSTQKVRGSRILLK